MTKLHEIKVIRKDSQMSFEQNNENLKGEFTGYSLSTSKVAGKRMWYASIDNARNIAISIDKCIEEIDENQELDKTKNQYKIEKMHVLYVKEGDTVLGYLQDNKNLKNLTSVVYVGHITDFLDK